MQKLFPLELRMERKENGEVGGMRGTVEEMREAPGLEHNAPQLRTLAGKPACCLTLNRSRRGECQFSQPRIKHAVHSHVVRAAHV